MKINLEIHKVRFDRGRTYYSYINAPLTAFLVWAFATQEWKWKIIYSVLTVLLIYVFGLIDEKFKIIHREQKRYASLNPIMQQIINTLNDIKQKLYEKDSVVDGDRLPDSGTKSSRKEDLAREIVSLSDEVAHIETFVRPTLGDTRRPLSASSGLRNTKKQDKSTD